MKTKKLTFNGIEYFYNQNKIPKFIFEDGELRFSNFDLAHKVGGDTDNKVHSNDGHNWLEIR